MLNPIPFYRTLRETDPVHWAPEVHGWFLTRHDDVMNSFRDARFSANRVSLMEQQLQGLDPSLLEHFTGNIKLQMMMYDGRDHIRMRRQANPSFTPQALDSWLPAIRRTMHMLLDRVQKDGQMDFVPSVSYELPPRVIGELFGMPQEEHELLLQWAAPIAEFGGLTVGMDVVTMAKKADTAMKEFAAHMTALAEKRRHEPGQDLLSQMMHGHDPRMGPGMTMEELVANAILMLNAGHMTTTDQLSNLIHDLLTHPEQLRLLQQDPKLLSAAVEESLRYRPAVPFHYRIVGEEMQLRGKTLRKGDVVFMGIAAANRDPAVFSEPDRFDITRDHLHQKHLTFSFGPHHCLGAGLARRELEIALEVLLQRMPELRLDPERPPRHKCSSLIFRGFDSMHVRW
ncbi:cytochrome P450 [Archangium gephyra]|uniref:cytochrome P450 n=1 Tax=Archangium gephyra TaxID=48 RepID=UPI003B81A9E7